MDEQGHMHVHLVCQRCGFTPNIETSDIEQEQD
jgi:Fe2+ or Zn2+ uptake regulation protein